MSSVVVGRRTSGEPHKLSGPYIRDGGMGIVFLLGLVSLLADITYEGARSVVGPFLASLGAGPQLVGLVAGAGELLGYLVRLPAGIMADRLRRLWAMAASGYLANLVAVPALALAGNWAVATSLLFMERLGKGIRTPARDVILAHAAGNRRGISFGIHELLDQVGAVMGPLVMVGAIAITGTYRAGFALLAIPGALALIVLWAVARIYPEAGEGAAIGSKSLSSGRGGRLQAWPSPMLVFYLLFVTFSVMGLFSFQLLSFHIKQKALLPDAAIPGVFAGAMAADALVAPLVGRWFDVRGLGVLWIIPFASALVTMLALAGAPVSAITASVLWGVVIGCHETVLRAAVVDLSHPSWRGMAYGLFNTAYGLVWIMEGAAMGALYGLGQRPLIAFSLACQLASIPFLALVARRPNIKFYKLP